MSFIKLKNISKVYGEGKTAVKALNNIDLEIKKGEMIAIMGTSGSGKSTLLNILGLLDISTTGEYFINGININSLPEKEKAFYRNEIFGFVVQDFALIEKYKAIDNIKIPFSYTRRKIDKKEITKRIHMVTKKMGIIEKLQEPAYNLSGGQRQRVAIARAIVNDPQIILADEPTGALDSENTKDIMNLFKKLNEEGKTIVIITHDEEVARYCDYTIKLKDGELEIKQFILSENDVYK